MVTDWNMVSAVSVTGVLFLMAGLLFGFIWGFSNAETQYQEEKKKLEQQKMWNEYINALKGGRYEK